MKEYDKIKSEQAEQLGSIDKVHPMNQVAIMSVIQIAMLIGVGLMMLLIGKSI
jgi:hypothetical protein